MPLHHGRKSSPPAAIFQPIIHVNAMAAWALPQTLPPTGELTVLPRPLGGFGGRGEGRSIRYGRIGQRYGKGMAGKGGMRVEWTQSSFGGNQRPWVSY